MSSTSTLPPQASQPPLRLTEPRLIHAFILLVTSGLTVLVTAILGPSLPAMQAHFRDVPGADYLVPLTMTAPMLMMACLSVFAGELSDRLGRKRLLVVSTVLYAAVGTAPLYLESLGAIIASRFALGILEAVLMTVSTTMIGDYYSGTRRERFMSLQTTVSATSAFLLNTVGGVIAEHGWRAPYAVFACSLLLAPLMVIYLWEPKGRSSMTPEQYAQDSRSFRAGMLAFNCALTVPLGMMFLTVPVHFGYLHGAIGVQSPAQIGIAYGINSLGVITGTLLFGWVLASRLKVPFQLTIGALIAGVGFVLMQSATDYTLLTVAGLVNGLGAGILLPTMVTWNMRDLPVSRRGLGTGAFQSCFCLGMFVNPLLIVGMEKHLEIARAHAIGLVGQVMLGLAVVALLVGLLRRGR
ncbi:putative MFS family arabinose efflux permease [Sphaerotilus hippei]|uniref:Putative MFS family arabinose efflux permease n=1 Tax=Sphaerotilus hippei TaxID=744406 RepID=A0A318HAS2_9BURK|nr:MFS transporter [Sphaerotilus hippei]PXW97582.1 putative MFS family arabinose efflux permease [Sphaerotilus hippei]